MQAASEDARACFKQGNAYFAAGQLSEAQQAFGNALRSAQLPDDAALLPKVHVNLGIALEASNQMAAACKHYRWAASQTVRLSKSDRCFELSQVPD